MHTARVLCKCCGLCRVSPHRKANAPPSALQPAKRGVQTALRGGSSSDDGAEYLYGNRFYAVPPGSDPPRAKQRVSSQEHTQDVTSRKLRACATPPITCANSILVLLLLPSLLIPPVPSSLIALAPPSRLPPASRSSIMPLPDMGAQAPRLPILAYLA